MPQINLELYSGSEFHPFTKDRGSIKISKNLMDQYHRMKELVNVIEKHIHKKRFIKKLKEVL